MGQYSIKELEKLSGIKAHTIRIWEKRYNLIQPLRTPTNIRFYSDDDLKKIINVSALNNRGLKISAIARLSESELANKVIELSQSGETSEVHIDALITSMLDLDEAKFRKDLTVFSERFGLEHTVTQIVYPFLTRIGVLWQTGNITPAHEHFISNLIRQWILVSIDSLAIANRNAFKVVLFLPENELHEIGLLFSHYVIRKAGFQTFYLGQSVPFTDLVAVGNIHQPHILITHITSQPDSAAIGSYLSQVCEAFSTSWVWATGSILGKISLRFPKNLRVFNDMTELSRLIKEVGQ